MIKTDKAIYRTRTLTEYDWLMEKLEEAGCVWINVRKPTESAKFYMYKSDTCIFVEDKKLIYSDFDFYKNESDYKDYEFIEVSELMGNEKETEDSELLPDKLEQIFHRQAVLSVQEINLNDAPTDTFSLNDVYEAKPEELELAIKNI